jgi:ketosteroid isomerase-like protein
VVAPAPIRRDTESVAAKDLEAVRRGIDAYNRGDVEGMLETTSEDVVMVPMRALLEGGEYHGHDGVRRFMADMDEDWVERGVEVDEIRELEDSWLVLGVFRAVGRSGTEVRFPVAWHSVMRGGKLVRMTAYSDQDAALRELGLSPESAAD